MPDVFRSLENDLTSYCILNKSAHRRVLAMCKRNYRFGEVKFRPSIRTGEFNWMTFACSGHYEGCAIVEYRGADMVIPKKHFKKHFRIFMYNELQAS